MGYLQPRLQQDHLCNKMFKFNYWGFIESEFCNDLLPISKPFRAVVYCKRGENPSFFIFNFANIVVSITQLPLHPTPTITTLGGMTTHLLYSVA